MFVKVTHRDSEKTVTRVTADEAASEQLRLIEWGLVIAGSSKHQREYRCKRTGLRITYTAAEAFTRLPATTETVQ
jgi:hypothetical protein